MFTKINYIHKIFQNKYAEDALNRMDDFHFFLYFIYFLNDAEPVSLKILMSAIIIDFDSKHQ